MQCFEKHVEETTAESEWELVFAKEATMSSAVIDSVNIFIFLWVILLFLEPNCCVSKLVQSRMRQGNKLCNQPERFSIARPVPLIS